jgi:hypothetical protein
MMEYMVVQQERMLKQIPQTQIINIKITLDHCKMTISQLKFLQMLTHMAIMQTTTAPKQLQPLTLPGEAQILMFL